MNLRQVIGALVWVCAFCQSIVGTVTAQLVDPTPITAEQVEIGRELLHNFVRNRDLVKRYACAIHVDTTVDDIRDPANSLNNSEWYFHAADADLKISRQDELVWKDTINIRRGPGEFEFPRITFFSGREVIQVLEDRKTISRAEVTDEVNEEIYRKFNSQAITVPWELPFVGCPEIHVSQSSKRLFVRTDLVNVIDQSAKPVAFNQVLNRIAVEYTIAPKNRSQNELSLRILFDASKGNMPTECVYFPGNGNSRRSETKWFKWNNHWLPSEVEVEMRLGGKPEAPTTIIHDSCRFQWVIADNVSDQVFVTESPGFLKSAELRNAILEFAIPSP